MLFDQFQQLRQRESMHGMHTRAAVKVPWLQQERTSVIARWGLRQQSWCRGCSKRWNEKKDGCVVGGHGSGSKGAEWQKDGNHPPVMAAANRNQNG